MTTQTQTQKDRAERAGYAAIDAIQRLCDMGYGGSDTERAFEQVRSIMGRIEAIPIRHRTIPTRP